MKKKILLVILIVFTFSFSKLNVNAYSLQYEHKDDFMVLKNDKNQISNIYYSNINELNHTNSFQYRNNIERQSFQINTSSQNQFNYFLLNGSSKIKITKSGGGYSASRDDKNITISNINELNPNVPQDYIVLKGSEYKIVSSITKEIRNDGNVQIFASAEKISSINNLSNEEIKLTCQNIFGKNFLNFLRENLYVPFVIIIPIILIVLTSIDFMKVIFSDDKDSLKKAWDRFSKRIIVSVIVLLVPTILIFLADIMGTDEIIECAKTIRNYSQKNS